MEEQRRYTADEIEELKKKDPSELTSHERQLVNLKPVREGDPKRANSGRKKGCVNWSTQFQNLMNDERMLEAIAHQMPKKWSGVVGEYPATVIAAGVVTIATREVLKAMEQDKNLSIATLKTLELIGKLGYGDKVVHEADGDGFFNQAVFNFVTKPDRKQPDEES